MSDAKIRISATDATGAGIASARARLGQLAAEAASIGDKFARFGGLLSALAAGGALGSLIKSTVDGIDALNDLADATGSSVENLSALEDAARRTGTGLDVVGGALIKLNKTIALAKPGSEAAQALEAIGLSAKQLRDLDPSEALLRVAQGLARFNDDGNKARLTQELFGKSLREVAPLLKDLVEQGGLNATVTKEQAEAAERFKRNTAELSKSLTDLARTITGPVIEALNTFNAEAKKRGFWSALFLDSDEQQAEKRAKYLATKVKKLQGEIADALKAGDKDLADKLGGQLFLLQGAQQFAAAAERSARDKLRGLEAASATRESAPVITGKAELTDFDKFIRKLQEAQLATLDLTEVEKTRIAINKGELGVLTQQQKDYALAIAAVNDTLRGRGPVDARAFNLGDELKSERFQNLVVNVRELASQSRASQIERLAQAMASVRDQMAAGGLTADEYTRALDVLRERMRALEDNTQGLGEKLGQLNEDARDAAQEIQGALGSSLLAVMEGNARKIDRIWGDLLRRLVAQAAAKNLMGALFGKAFTQTGELGGLIGDLWRSVGGAQSPGASAGASAAAVAAKPMALAAPGKAAAATATAGVNQYITVQGDVGVKARRAMLGVAAQIQARNQRQAAI